MTEVSPEDYDPQQLDDMYIYLSIYRSIDRDLSIYLSIDLSIDLSNIYIHIYIGLRPAAAGREANLRTVSGEVPRRRQPAARPWDVPPPPPPQQRERSESARSEAGGVDSGGERCGGQVQDPSGRPSIQSRAQSFAHEPP